VWRSEFRIRYLTGWSRAPGVVVVLGPVWGSTITSWLSTEFGREVYGVPGNVTEPVSFVANQLIKQGAKLAASWEDGREAIAGRDSRGASSGASNHAARASVPV
jgi:DNA processing protein